MTSRPGSTATRVVLAVVLLLVAAGTAATLLAGIAPASADDTRSLTSGATGATARFHDLDAAEAAGYTMVVTDTTGKSCIDEPGMGAMGVHYANGALFADPAIDAATPEVLVYAPERDGHLRLVALEYVVLKDAWDATHDSPPELFERTFNFTPSPNRFGLPPYYSLHAWIWDPNPSGLLAPWNPRVSCPPT
jgi:hypothetical protein